MTVTIRNVPRDRRVERAFTKSLAKTPVVFDCSRGLHKPRFGGNMFWHCDACGRYLDLRARPGDDEDGRRWR